MLLVWQATTVQHPQCSKEGSNKAMYSRDPRLPTYTSQEAWYCCLKEGPLQTWLRL